MGVFFLFQTVLSLIALPADLGIRDAIEKRISEGGNKKEILTTGFIIKIFLSLLLGIFILIFRENINDYIGANASYLLIIGLILKGLSDAVIRTLRGELRVGETASLQISETITWVGIGALLVIYGVGYRGLIFGLVASLFIVFSWGTYKKSTKFGRFSFDQARSMWDYSKYSFIGAMGGSFFSWMDVAVIGFFLPQNYVGAYEMAWRIGAAATILSSTIAVTIFPQVSHWSAEEAYSRIESLLPKAFTISMFLVIPALFGSIVLSEDILRLIFGEGFALAKNVLIIFMGINIFKSITVINSRVLKAIDHPELVAKARIISIISNAFLNMILVWQFGIIGAAAATGISFTTYTILSVLFLRRHMKIIVPYVKLFWFLVASVIMAIIVFMFKRFVEVHSVVDLTLAIVIGMMFYFSIVLIYEPIRRDLAELL